MAALKITLFASFQVVFDGRSVTDFATDKARALLVYLLVERRQPHRRESLAALLWPDQPEARARQNLRQALSNLRQALGDSDDSASAAAPTPPFLLIDRHEVQFNPQAEVWLDVAEFTALVENCTHHRHRQMGQCLPCLQRLEAMLALYSGDFLAGFLLSDSAPFEEWALLKREWLHCQAVEALGHLADFYERRGDLAAARRYAQQQVRLEPWREEAHRQLMRLLAEDGQRSAALAQYETCRRALARELGVEPTRETLALYERICAAPSSAAKRPSTINLPPAATPFIGRAVACTELAEMLADPDGRLITLVGPGGIGKTRLAMQVAEAHLGLYADGVYWVALAAVPSDGLIIPTIAQTIGLTLYGKEPPAAQLLAYLRQKRLLLVLDNVEHLPGVAELIAALLPGAPDVTFLVTSRQRLDLREEWLYAVEGLPYGSALAAADEAAQLFIRSVQRAYRSFAPTPADWQAVAAICRLVEGMPLALELAAVWVPDLSCAAVAHALADDMALLTASWRNAPERQRSVQATFEHSWALLPAAERLFFARLALFRGGFAGLAAAQVADAAAPVLARLAAKSLLRRVGDGRYQLHELLRQFAADKLATYPGEAEQTAVRHAHHYLSFLAGYEIALKGAGQEEALLVVGREIANVRQAWDWAVAQIAAGGADAAELLQASLESLFLFYALRSWYQEGAVVFAQAVTAVSPAIPGHRLLRSELLARQARCLEFTAPPEEAIALYQESLACFQALGALQQSALPLYGLGYMAHIQGDYEAAQGFFRESLAQYQASGDRWGMANVLSSLALVLRRQGAFAAARHAGQESLVIRREIGDRRGIASSQNNLGLVYCALGDYQVAEEALRESVAICREIGHTVGTANAITGLCHVAVSAKAYADAARYQQEALELYREVGDFWGVAIAYNNLGQIAMEDGQIAAAQTFLAQGVQVYRELGIKSGLAHALSNLGQANYVAGHMAAAARYLAEALSIAHEVGDRPTILEVLARTAVLWAGQEPGLRPLVVLAFVLRQPELLAETRRTAVAQYAELQARFTPEQTAVAQHLAAGLDFAAITSESLQTLQQIRPI
ncbi:MAG: tetratricopeptide repeat protein [Chloroflexi bacterium]|nr:tetratricopeptide repeat protein [Chloroflexota bacterium]